MLIESIKNKKELISYVESLDFDEILKDERICKVINIFNNQNISVHFNKEKKFHSYNGYFSENLTISIMMYDAIFDSLYSYKRKNETFGDMYIENTVVSFKDDSDVIIYTVLLTLIHEYKHYLQLINGEMLGVDISFNKDIESDSYGYQHKSAEDLEYDAEEFAMVNTYQIMLKNNYSNIIKKAISIEDLKSVTSKNSNVILEDEKHENGNINCDELEGWGYVDINDLPDFIKL